VTPTDVPAELADRLYAVAPRRFVAERDAAAERARGTGDAALAAAIGKLRRPTVAAWLVNLLALRRPDLMAELGDLAAALRDAQQRLRGDQLRELSARRREAVAGLVAAARSVAVAEEPDLAGAKLPLAEVEATLTAALADDQVAVRVRAGRLLRPVEHAGFAGVTSPLRLVPGGAGGTAEPAAPPTSPDEIRREWERARAELTTAQAGLDEVTAGKREAQQELARTDAAVAALAAELTERRAARTGVASRLAEAEAAELGARRAVAGARRRLAGLPAPPGETPPVGGEPPPGG
jgi:hypothetical protein